MLEASPTSSEAALSELQGLLAEALEKAEKWDRHRAKKNAYRTYRGVTLGRKEMLRRASRKWKASHLEREPARQEKTCPVCSGEFVSAQANQVYCARKCKWKAERPRPRRGVKRTVDSSSVEE